MINKIMSLTHQQQNALWTVQSGLECHSFFPYLNFFHYFHSNHMNFSTFDEMSYSTCILFADAHKKLYISFIILAVTNYVASFDEMY